MFNRYGPWLDINVVYPISPTECIIKFEWFIKKELISNDEFINKCLESSELVQIEDIILCENVMKGVLSDAYDKGRYVPSKETPLYQFHLDLLNDLK
jgi:choline monooxygenase